MPFYQRRGELPRKRHIVFRENGRLLTEEVMGLEGFTGNESILYHLQSPCRVKELGAFTPIEREEWVPENHAHLLMNTYDVDPSGDEISGRRTLMWNQDVEISLCRPDSSMDYFFRNGEGDEVIFVHEGSGTLETTFGDVPYKDGDYLVIPRGTTYRFVPARPAAPSRLRDARADRDPAPVPEPVRPDPGGGALLPPRHPPAVRAQDAPRAGDLLVKVRVRGGFQEYVLDYHPFDVVGWDGYLYPWTFSIHDFEPITGRIHQPPPSHQTFQGPNFVICSFCPRKLDFDPDAVPIPYHHSNLQSEEMIYYVSGNFGSRKGISVGSVTLHPSGLPHGPQPGLAEKSLGVAETTELAVMCDTFRPLKLSTLARDLDDGKYALSWYEPPSEEPEPGRRDESPVGARLARHGRRPLPARAPAALRGLPALRASARPALRPDHRPGGEPREGEQLRAARISLRPASSPTRRTSRSASSTARASIAAMLGNEGRRFVGIDSFEFRDASLEKVERNLARSAPAPGAPRGRRLRARSRRRARGDAGRASGTTTLLHTYEAQLDGLRDRRALLAPGALLIVDDTDWEQVERAMDDYLAEQPRARRILTIDGKEPRIPPVVGGNAGPRLERVEPGRAGSTRRYVPRSVRRRLRTTPLLVVQREGRGVGLALRHGCGTEAAR